MGLGGLEPPASPLSGVRSNHLSYRPSVLRRAPPPCRCLADSDGGADRDRTGDPLLAKQVLSQLSYSPVASLRDPARPGVRTPTRLRRALRPREAVLRVAMRLASPSSGIAPLRGAVCRLLWSGVLCGRPAALDLSKGGDPAAPSDTATLLRLHPSHEPHRGRRPPCG